VHGSAPDIAGKWICNPSGQIWSGAMMLEHLGEKDAAAAILKAIEDLLAEGGPRTRDMGGNAGTVDVGKALAEAVARG
jgi:tartrate dehydrogenase/decarboxylase/D-malate dehydrogenase